MNGYELAQAFQKEDVLREATLIAISGFGQHHDRGRPAPRVSITTCSNRSIWKSSFPFSPRGPAGRYAGKQDAN